MENFGQYFLMDNFFEHFLKSIWMTNQFILPWLYVHDKIIIHIDDFVQKVSGYNKVLFCL